MNVRCFILIISLLYAINCDAQRRRTPVFDWDAKMDQMGLVDVCHWEPSIQAYLVYRTANNFMGKPLYNRKLTKAWLHPRAATKIIRAQELLRKERPTLSILILDAARPVEVQQLMSEWAEQHKNNYYVANPEKGGGLHNYGMAVDVTLVDANGDRLPMGTPFDFFGPEANTDREDELLKNKQISQEEYDNRRFLRRVMQQAGFQSVTSEWWHFNACTREEAVKSFKPIREKEPPPMPPTPPTKTKKKSRTVKQSNKKT